MKTQTAAVNDLIGAVRTFLIMTRGSMYTPQEHGQRMVLDGARDDLMGTLAVFDATFPDDHEGDREVDDWQSVALHRLTVIEGLNRVNGEQARRLREQEAQIEALKKEDT